MSGDHQTGQSLSCRKYECYLVRLLFPGFLSNRVNLLDFMTCVPIDVEVEVGLRFFFEF